MEQLPDVLVARAPASEMAEAGSGEHGIARDGKRARRELSSRMERLRIEDDEEFRKVLR